MIPTLTPFCLPGDLGLERLSVLPKATKKLQRKSSFFVQQVIALSFPMVMAVPG